MKGFLLDTSTCVAIFRGNRDVADKMEKVGKDVTHNVKHFSHIEGIKIEDWIK